MPKGMLVLKEKKIFEGTEEHDLFFITFTLIPYIYQEFEDLSGHALNR